MPKYVFQNRNLLLDFGCTQFALRIDGKLGTKLRPYGTGLQELAVSIGQGKKTDTDAKEYCKNAIDDILGEGAVQKIFAERPIEPEDLMDILWFIVQEVTKFNSNNKRTIE